MSSASNGMRVLTNDELDLVTGGGLSITIEFSVGPIKIEIITDRHGAGVMITTPRSRS